MSQKNVVHYTSKKKENQQNIYPAQTTVNVFRAIFTNKYLYSTNNIPKTYNKIIKKKKPKDIQDYATKKKLSIHYVNMYIIYRLFFFTSFLYAQ